MRRLILTKLTHAFLVFCIMAPAVRAQTFQTIVNFYGGNGGLPVGLLQASNGNLYGTTASGGTKGQGTIYELSPSGVLTTLYNFCSQPNCTDGDGSNSSLIEAADGNFYGTTSYGGPNDSGTVFEITAAGEFKVIYSFCSQPNCTDGKFPWAGLLQATNGTFYDTTNDGGAYNQGSIFEMTPAGKLTTLHSFDFADGSNPLSVLVQGKDGNFYGTTAGGGDLHCIAGCGTVFRITPAGKLTTLHTFLGYPIDGSYPDAGLLQTGNGTLYGTTTQGGVNRPTGGTVFEILASGTFHNLYSFCVKANCTDGTDSDATLIQGSDGTFYGTTEGDGKRTFGTVFQITPAGDLTTLHSFDGSHGEFPIAGLLQGSNGDFYGTTFKEGPGGYGTVFSISAEPRQ